MMKMTRKMREIEILQRVLDYRTSIENKAIELMKQGEYKKAIELLKTI